jgi:hypothetical protein
MAALVYFLCALTSLTCFALLWRGYRQSRTRLLFWSALCFAALALSNALLVLDKVVFPVEVDLRYWRLGISLGAVLLLLYGLIWEED